MSKINRKSKKMNEPIVSFVITVYNNDDFIKECIDSVCSQTYKKIEIIIVDDGSDDNSPEICDEYERNYDFIYVVHKKNEGVSIARNVGIDSAKGKYITFIDGDDKITSDYCEKMLNCAEKEESDIVVCDYSSFGSGNPSNSSFSKACHSVQDYKREMILRALFREYGGHIDNSVVSAGATWGKLYRLDFIRRINSRFVPGLVRAQDTVFWLNTLVRTDRIVHLEYPLYCYRLNDQSVCGGSRFFPNSEVPFGMLLKEYEKFLENYNLGDEYRQAYYCRAVEVLFWHWKHNYFNEKNNLPYMTRVKKFCELMNTEPYNKSLKEVNIGPLSRRQKALVLFYRLNAEALFVILYNLLNNR